MFLRSDSDKFIEAFAAACQLKPWLNDGSTTCLKFWENFIRRMSILNLAFVRKRFSLCPALSGTWEFELGCHVLRGLLPRQMFFMKPTGNNPIASEAFKDSH